MARGGIVSFPNTSFARLNVSDPKLFLFFFPEGAAASSHQRKPAAQPWMTSSHSVERATLWPSACGLTTQRTTSTWGETSDQHTHTDTHKLLLGCQIICRLSGGFAEVNEAAAAASCVHVKTIPGYFKRCLNTFHDVFFSSLTAAPHVLLLHISRLR